MAINKQIQFLRNTNKIYASRTEAVNAIETLVTGASTKGKILDGQPILARYKGTDGKVKTVTASVYKASNGSTQVTYYDEHVDEVYVGSGTPPSTTKLAVDVKGDMVSIVQNTGTGTKKTIDVMSQKAVTDAIDAASAATKQSTIDALCDNVYIDASTPNTSTLFSDENKRYNVSIPLTLKAGSVYRVGKGSVIHFYMDGKLTGTGSIELNNTQIEAPKKRIFDDTVVIKGLMRCDAVYPEWFGAVGDGVTDDAGAIQKAIYNAGHMPVVLTAEKYLVKSTITLAEPFPNSNINPYFEYAHEKGSVWNDKQTLIVEHDIVGDISLNGPVIRTGSNHNYIKINGSLVVRCPQDTAIGIDTAGTKASGDTTSMTDIRSGDFGYSSEIEVRSVIKGKDGFSYQNSADATYATTYGLGKGTAIVFCSGAGGSCTVREINGFGVGIHMPFANGTKVSVNTCGCINDFLINGGARFLGGGVTRNDIRLGTHYLSKNWSWTSGRTDICIIRVNDDNTSAGKPVEVANNTFTIDSNNTSSAYIYNYILYKCGTTNFRGNKLITSCTLMNTGMSPWIPVKIAPATNGSSQNNANLLVNKVAWDYKTLDITKGYNTVVENVIIDSQTHTSTYRYGDTASDVQNRFLCEKIIITTKNAPEYPSTLSEDSIKVIVPHYSQVSKTHFVDTLPAEGSRENGHIYILKAVANTGGFEKHEVWGMESGVFKQLGYYSPDCDTQFVKNLSTQVSDNVTIDDSTQLTSTTFAEENKRYNITVPVELSSGTTYTVGSGSVIHFYMDGKFTGSGTLQLNNTQIEAPKKRIFDDTVNVAGLMRCDAVYPEWFGAVGDGVTDDATAINKAIYNAGHMPVVLTAEKYLVKSTITMVECWPNTGVTSAFGYVHKNGTVYNIKQTLIVEHDIIGDISLDGAVIRSGSNYNKIVIKGSLVVRCPNETAVGIDMYGTTRTEASNPPEVVNSGDIGFGTNIEINQIIKGPDSFNYLDSVTNTANISTTYGLGKGTALIIAGQPHTKCKVNFIIGFGVGLHTPSSQGSIFDIGLCCCIVDILIDGGENKPFLPSHVNNNHFRIGDHHLDASWPWVKGRSDVDVIRIGENKSLDWNNKPTHVINVWYNTFRIDGAVDGFMAYNRLFSKHGTNSFIGNKLITGRRLVDKQLRPWKPLSITPVSNSPEQNNNNVFYCKFGWDYANLEITKGFNCVVENIIIDSRTHVHTDGFGFTSQDKDIKERFLCEKIIITAKNSPELPATTTEDSIMIIVPHHSQMSKVHFVSEKPTSTTAQKGHIYVLDAVANTGGSEKHEVWGIESGTLKQLGYYSYDYLTQGAADRRYAKLNDTTQRISASSIVANTVSVDNNGFIMIGDHALAPANDSLTYNDYKLLDSSSIVQATGTSTTSVMSQKAISDALSKKADLTNSKQTIRTDVTWTNAIYLGDDAYELSFNRRNGDLTYNGDKVMVGSTVSNEVSLVQNTGQSTTSVMSQKAVSDALSTKVDKTDITQSTGTSTTAVMSQKAVSDAINKLKNAGYLYAGISTPTTNPGTPDGPVFYIASQAGTYSNFGNTEIDNTGIFTWDGTSWSFEKLDFGGGSNIEIINDLTTGGEGNALSAEMGKEIKRNYLNALDEITTQESVETTTVTSFINGEEWYGYGKNVGSTWGGQQKANNSNMHRADVKFVAGDTLRVWGKGTGVANVWILLDENDIIKAKSSKSSGGEGVVPNGSIPASNPDVLTPDYNGRLLFSSRIDTDNGVTVTHTYAAHIIIADSENNGLMPKELASTLDESFFKLVDDIKQTPYTEDINVDVLYNSSYYLCFQTASIGTTWNPSTTAATDKKCTKHSIKKGDVIDIWGQGTGPAALYVITDEDNIVRARDFGGYGVGVSTVFTEEDPLTITSQWSGTLYMNCVRTVAFGATIHRVHSGAKRATSEQDGLMTKEQVSVMDELAAALASQSGGLAQKLIAVIGDSFSAPGAWQSRMNQILGSSTYNVAKSGGRWASTDPTTDAYRQATNLVTDFADIERKPDYILCVLGVNDVNNSVTLGDIVYSDTIGSDGIDISTFTGGMQAVLKTLKDNFTSSIIKVGFTPGGMQYLATSSEIMTRMATYIERMKEVATLYGVGYIETRATGMCRIVASEYNAYVTSAGNPHPNAAGHQRIGEYMSRILLSNL